MVSFSYDCDLNRDVNECEPEITMERLDSVSVLIIFCCWCIADIFVLVEFVFHRVRVQLPHYVAVRRAYLVALFTPQTPLLKQVPRHERPWNDSYARHVEAIRHLHRFLGSWSCGQVWYCHYPHAARRRSIVPCLRHIGLPDSQQLHKIHLFFHNFWHLFPWFDRRVTGFWKTGVTISRATQSLSTVKFVKWTWIMMDMLMAMPCSTLPLAVPSRRSRCTEFDQFVFLHVIDLTFCAKVNFFISLHFIV